jgi:class 3 adenylate cyclase
MNKLASNKIISLQNIFLYFVIVILPLSVIYFSLSSMIEEQLESQKQVLATKLGYQAARIKKISKVDYQLREFITGLIKKKICQQSPETIEKLIKRVDELYPGAFRWLFWDEKGTILKLKSKNILQGRRAWQKLFSGMMASLQLLGFQKQLNYNHILKEMAPSLSIIQKALGPTLKVEHISYGREKVIHGQWFKKDCLFAWDVQVKGYKTENIPSGIYGGLLTMVFPEKFKENFWIKRFIQRRKRNLTALPFPIIAVDITDKNIVAINDRLRFPGIGQKFIASYLNRNRDIFYLDNFMAKSAIPEFNSTIRIISVCDISKIKQSKENKMLALRLAITILLITSFFIPSFILNLKTNTTSLRTRIAFLFLISILLPVLSLISIGKTLISHEKARLKDSAFLEMRSAIESLDIRYKDAARKQEKMIFSELKKLLGNPPYSKEQVTKAMQKAAEYNFIKYYVLSDVDGKLEKSNWEGIPPIMKNAIQMSMKALIKKELEMKQSAASQIQSAMDDELKALLSITNQVMDFSRPSHLRKYVFMDTHFYFMGMKVNVGGSPRALVVQVPDFLIEKNFARNEFKANRQASINHGQRDALQSELNFFSMHGASKSLPESSPLLTELNSSAKRAYSLKTEEFGEVKIENERFLYLIAPLRSMNSQSYLPCLITPMRQIETRLSELNVVIFSLAALAALAAIIISLVLASSLLTPIKQIDQAAFAIGQGDLTVNIPTMGSDELGRLSNTFNNMVKGLRERQRMKAYVSDSVLEAVQDETGKETQEGKVIEATILFSDIRSFTTLSEKYRPDKIFALLNEFLGGVEPIIRDNHGRVDKFIGDAVMAVFHDSTSEHHALSAVKAAVKMKKFVKELNYKRKNKGLFTINIGIGISTGKVMLGDVGSQRRKDLTVIGDEVNLAARLESASKKGRHSKIIVSGSTYKHIKSYVETEQMPFTEIRGKKQAVKIYELIKLKA